MPEPPPMSGPPPLGEGPPPDSRAPDSPPPPPASPEAPPRATREQARQATEAELGVKFSSRLTPTWGHALRAAMPPALIYWVVLVILMLLLSPETVRELDVWAAFDAWSISAPGSTLMIVFAIGGGWLVALVARRLFYRQTGHMMRLALLLAISVLFSLAGTLGLTRVLAQSIDALVGPQGPVLTLMVIGIVAALTQGGVVAALLKSGGATKSALGADMDMALRDKERRRRRFQQQMQVGRSPGVLAMPRTRTQVIEDLLVFLRRAGIYTLEVFTVRAADPPALIARARRRPDPVRLALTLVIAVILTWLIAWIWLPPLTNAVGCNRLPAALTTGVPCDFTRTAHPGVSAGLPGLLVPTAAGARDAHMFSATLTQVLVASRQTVVVAIDVSESMGGGPGSPLASARQAGLRLADELPLHNRLALVRFAAQAEPVPGSAVSRSQFKQSLRATQIESRGTNLQAALESARSLIDARGAHAKGVVIIISDGADTTGGAPGVVARQLGLQGVKVYSLYAGATGGDPRGRALLGDLSGLSGGDLVETTTSSQIGPALARIGEETTKISGEGTAFVALRESPAWQARLRARVGQSEPNPAHLEAIGREYIQMRASVWWIDAVAAVAVALLFTLILTLVGLPLLGGIIRPGLVLAVWLAVAGAGSLAAAAMVYLPLSSALAGALTGAAILLLPAALVVGTTLTAMNNFAPRRTGAEPPLDAAPRVADIAEIRVSQVAVAPWMVAAGAAGVLVLMWVPMIGMLLACAFPAVWIMARSVSVAIAVDSDFDGTRVSVVPSGAKTATRRLLRRLARLGARLPSNEQPDALGVGGDPGPQATFRG